jgi:hypothetical protein
MCCVWENRSIEAPNAPLRVFADGSLLRCERIPSSKCRLIHSATGATTAAGPQTKPTEPVAAGAYQKAFADE